MKAKVILKAAPRLLGACFGMKAPVRVTHCITYRCNLDCRYCSRHNGKVDELPTFKVKALMKSFADAGCVFWSFNGGEALIRDDIGELIDHGRDLGLYMTLATNGTLVADKIRQLVGLDAISVSIDGPKAVQDELRCGSYDRIIAGLEALNAVGIKTTFTTVVGRHNISSLGSVLDLAEKYRAKVFFQPIRVQKEDLSGKAKNHFPTREEMAQAMDYLSAERKKGRPVASSPRYLRAIRDSWPDRMPPVRCFAGKVFCFITPKGDVTACCDTLAYADKDPSCDAVARGAGAFKNIPKFKCETCYSSMPLEANLMIDSPLTARPPI
jgi:MoaA/NifB/PqqE/SkfB family radical SAM enzyme